MKYIFNKHIQVHLLIGIYNISIGSEDKNIKNSLSSGNWAVTDQATKLII